MPAPLPRQTSIAYLQDNLWIARQEAADAIDFWQQEETLSRETVSGQITHSSSLQPTPPLINELMG